jgi:hypothetical protein
VPCQLGIDPNRNAVAFVGTDIAVQRVGFAFGKIGRNSFPKRVEAVGVDRLVRFAPIDVRFARWLPDEELVLG